MFFVYYLFLFSNSHATYECFNPCYGYFSDGQTNTITEYFFSSDEIPNLKYFRLNLTLGVEKNSRIGQQLIRRDASEYALTHTTHTSCLILYVLCVCVQVYVAARHITRSVHVRSSFESSSHYSPYLSLFSLSLSLSSLSLFLFVSFCFTLSLSH